MRTIAKIFIYFILFVLFVVIVGNYQMSRPPSNNSYDMGLRITKGKHIACSSDDDLMKVVNYATQNDRVAISKLVDGSRCINLKRGLRVYRTDISWHGTVKIRPEGQTFELWTFKEEIE